MGFRAKLLVRTAVVAAATLSMGGCNLLTRLSEVGEPPTVSRIQDPTKTAGYQPVSLPMPNPVSPQAHPNSLWRHGARGFFKDQRASDIGDILTVQVSINESGTLKNQTATTTANSEAANPNFTMLGAEGSIGKVFSGASAANLFSFGSTSGLNGTGSMTRQEQITVNLAAVITQKLPNGNMVISGKQELRVNSELRQLAVQGIIRPEDIASDNTISSDKIAEARIIYGGRGTLSDVQTPRYGQQIFDIIAPF